MLKQNKTQLKEIVIRKNNNHKNEQFYCSSGVVCVAVPVILIYGGFPHVYTVNMMQQLISTYPKYEHHLVLVVTIWASVNHVVSTSHKSEPN